MSHFSWKNAEPDPASDDSDSSLSVEIVKPVVPVDLGPTATEKTFFSHEFSRWHDPSYMLRIEECEILISLLNATSDALKLATLFLPSPANGIADPLRQLDRSIDVTEDVVSLVCILWLKTHRVDPFSIAEQFKPFVFFPCLATSPQSRAIQTDHFFQITCGSLDSNDPRLAFTKWRGLCRHCGQLSELGCEL